MVIKVRRMERLLGASLAWVLRGLGHAMEGGREGERVARDRQRLLDLPLDANRVITNGLFVVKSSI